MDFEYSWIVNGLAQGNFPGSAKTAFSHFDVVVLCAEEHQPPWQVPKDKHLFKMPLDDDPYRQVPLEVGRIVCHTAHAAGTYLVNGRSVLTSCHQGWNRSGITTAMILIMFMGMTPAKAIKLIRSRRNDDCIGNPMFEQFLHNWQAYAR
jgi:protein-tyrosine phosphatase